MTKNIVQEFYAGKSEKGKGMSIMFVIEDNKEIRLKISRDIAHDMIVKLYTALDEKGMLKNINKDMH